MPELKLTLLGPPAVHADGVEKTAALPAKPQAVLYFLARHRAPQTRSRVAGMLWPEATERAARANLRVALSRIRQVVGDCFASDRQMVGFGSAWTLRTDVDAFMVATAAGEWEGVLTHYQGAFLANFDVGGAQPFEEWLIVERERLYQQAVRALQQGLNDCIRDEAWRNGERLSRRMLALDPWREEAHRGLMLCLVETGRRAAALAQYESCRQILADELDVDPAPATAALYETIKGGGASRPAGTAVSRSQLARLPRPAAPLFGRTDALAEIVAALGGRQTRLLTLTGIGGSGKTRLAQAAARQIAAAPTTLFTDGVVWVPLAAEVQRENLLTAIATALDFSFTGAVPPQTQLADFLRYKELLLVLDDFEQLVPHAGLLSELLQAAPDVALLVTSRERLRLVEEWVLVLDGLPLPESMAELAASPSAQLFAARARRANMRFDLAAEADGVLAICRLVEGLPLGLELAASWTHAFTCADIAAAMARELDALAGGARDVPARHRSLRAAFEHSWQLLTPAERKSLMELAVFRGGFTLTSAERVAGAGRRTLTNLIEKSLIRRAAGRRYDMHQQLRQFVWGKLPEQDWPPVQGRLAAYVAGLIQAWLPAMNTPDQSEAFRTMHAELENIRAAWQFVLARRRVELLAAMADGLAYFYLRRGLLHEGFAAFGAAVEVVTSETATAGSPELDGLLARLLVWQGRCGEHISRDYAVSIDLFERGLALAQASQLTAVIAQAQLGLSLIAINQGRRAEAAVLLTATRASASAAADDSVLAGALNLTAWLALAHGERETGRSHCDEALRLQRRVGDSNGLASTLTTMGIILTDGGDYEAAHAAYSEALAHCQANGNRVGQSQALIGLFAVAAHQEAFVTAQAHAAASLAVSRDAGNRLGMAIAHHNLGYAAAGAGDHGGAVTHYERALEIYALLGSDVNRVTNTRRHLAESLLALGRREHARRVLCALLADLLEPQSPALADRFGPDVLALGAEFSGEAAPADQDATAALAAFARRLGC